MIVQTDVAYVRLDDGSVAKVAGGEQIPLNAAADHVAGLKAAGVLVDTPESPAPALVPNRASSTADWTTYATDKARGDERLTSEAVADMTRDQLAEHFLGPKEQPAGPAEPESGPEPDADADADEGS